MLNDRSLGVPDTGTLLDESFWLFRKNFTLFVAISTAMLVPYVVLSLVLHWSNPAAQLQTPGSLQDFLRMTFTSLGRPEQRHGLFSWLYMLVCQPLAAGAIVVAITECYAQRNVDARSSIATTLPSLIPLSVAQILLGLILVALAIPALLCGGITLNMWSSQLLNRIFDPSLTPVVTIPMVLVGLIGLALFILPLFVGLRLAFVSQLVMLEQMGPLKSIVRSWELSSGQSWRLLRIGIVTMLLQIIVVKLPAAVLSQLIATGTNGSEFGWMIGTLITRVSDIVVFPFPIIVYTLLFYSLSIQVMQDNGEQLSQARPFVLPGDNTTSSAPPA